ncbi:MAG: caspase family protein [Sandaracinaceae bacterium]
MTLVLEEEDGLWNNPGREAGEPGLFAVIIGISEYPHLAGGVDPAVKTYGFGQAPASALTAFRFFEWLRDEYRGGPPIATVRLFLAPTALEKPLLSFGVGERAQGAAGYGPATFAVLKKGLRTWKKEMESLSAVSAQSSGSLLFFSGHGLELLFRPVLVPSDWPTEKQQLISVEDVVQRMSTLGVPDHLILSDACRVAVPGLSVQPDAVFESLDEDDVPNRDFKANVFFASMTGWQAWAPADPNDGPSVFGRALLDGLRGCAPIRLRQVDVHGATMHEIWTSDLLEFLAGRIAGLLKQLVDAGRIPPSVDQRVRSGVGPGLPRPITRVEGRPPPETSAMDPEPSGLPQLDFVAGRLVVGPGAVFDDWSGNVIVSKQSIDVQFPEHRTERPLVVWMTRDAQNALRATALEAGTEPRITKSSGVAVPVAELEFRGDRFVLAGERPLEVFPYAGTTPRIGKNTDWSVAHVQLGAESLTHPWQRAKLWLAPKFLSVPFEIEIINRLDVRDVWVRLHVDPAVRTYLERKSHYGLRGPQVLWLEIADRACVLAGPGPFHLRTAAHDGQLIRLEAESAHPALERAARLWYALTREGPKAAIQLLLGRRYDEFSWSADQELAAATEVLTAIAVRSELKASDDAEPLDRRIRRALDHFSLPPSPDQPDTLATWTTVAMLAPDLLPSRRRLSEVDVLLRHMLRLPYTSPGVTALARILDRLPAGESVRDRLSAALGHVAFAMETGSFFTSLVVDDRDTVRDTMFRAS